MSLVSFDIKSNINFFGRTSYDNSKMFSYFYNNPFNISFLSKPVTRTNFLQNEKIALKSSNIAQMLNNAGYDQNKAKNLTLAAKKRAKENGWKHKCAMNVRLSLEETKLLRPNNGNGHAYQYAQTLSLNPNFKEIDVSNLSLADLKELSKYDGITYVYGRGVSNYDKESGHIEISLGNGTNGSDGITHNIRKGARVFIPVKTSYSGLA